MDNADMYEEKVLERIPQKPANISKTGLLNSIKTYDNSFTISQLDTILDYFIKNNIVTTAPLSNLVLGFKDILISKL